MDTRVIDKYLSGYAEPEARDIPRPAGHWNDVVCIPACAEADSLLETLMSLAQVRRSETALVIAVVNGRECASAEVQADNLRSLEQLQTACGVSAEPLSWGRLGALTVLVVDRARPGRWLPPRQGVGLARKIAGDLALALIRQGYVRSDWIRCTDADVTFPRDYLERLSAPIAGASAALMPFVHQPEGDELQRQAMKIYDRYLQSYVDGLEAAGSPYAFHTIGSLISVQAKAYAVVRGIPRREAGEDFYLLNKLAKVGAVHRLAGEPVRIRGRVSDRVPFGTGAALKEIRTALQRGEPTRSYDPRLFDGLKVWLTALKRFADHPDLEELEQSVLASNPPLGEALHATLSALGAFDAAKKASKQVAGDALHRRLMEWNDAFRTLKLVHGLRDAGISRPVLPSPPSR